MTNKVEQFVAEQVTDEDIAFADAEILADAAREAAEDTEARYFITVDRCRKGERGIFCDKEGHPFSKESPHSSEEMWEVLGLFDMILWPQSILLTKAEVAQYTTWRPLAEYSHEYGIARRE